ncbi:MAG: hypothetical protein M3N18_12755 [Actinomycetota bacterium]|nr:hypothetical protein [Actinomycetota bacterium]
MPERLGGWCPRLFPPREVVYPQTQRWIAARVFEAMVHDPRALLRLTSGRTPNPRRPRS